MEVVLAIVGKIGEYTVAPIGRQLSYFIQYNNNINGLRAQLESLNHVRHGVQGLVDAAERNGEVIKQNVQTWLTDVNKITTESNTFLNVEVNPNQRCSFRSCPNLILRYKVSRKAKKKILAVDELLRDNKFDGVSFPAPPPTIGSIYAGDVEVFGSRASTFTNIMEALKDDKTNMIGVYGMGGIGKTTLVKDVAKQAEEYKLFDEIAMAVVSQTPSITKIQDEIAAMLGLKLPEMGSVRAGKLFERIKKVKRILVILDDLWTRLDLEEIGLPRADVHKGCKILLTTRQQHVCVEMKSQKDFPINELPEREAWQLFRNIAGDTVDLPYLYPTAIKVAKECAGLPLAIVTVAGALMKIKELSEWKKALRQLQNPTTKNIKGVNPLVYSSLKLSYDFLNDEEVKYCFLLCSLGEEDSDILINDLVIFGMGLSLYDKGCTLEEARDTVRASVNKLKACCLLLDGLSKSEECVRMHDVVRDFAISVASENQLGIWARINVGRTEWSKNLSSLNDDDSAILFMHNKFHQFPDRLDCPKLKLLLLECFAYYSSSFLVPDNFFEGMRELRVIRMVKMHNPTLPSSVKYLMRLRTLCIEDCINLQDLSLIGELKGLEIIRFAGYPPWTLPREVGQLIRLRVLDLSLNHGLRVIPAGVISSLSQLEGLYLPQKFNDWGKYNNAIPDELKGLSNLSTLEIRISSDKLFPQDLHLPKLSEFKICLSYEFNETELIKYLKPTTLKLGIRQGNASLGELKMWVNKTESLIIEYTEEDLEFLLSNIKRDGFSRLKCFKVGRNDKVEYLVNTMSDKVFPVLERLELYRMRNLKEICRGGHLPAGSFCQVHELMLSHLPNLENFWVGNASLPNLTVVKIEHCDSLKKLFPQNIASGFGQLHTLQVEDCANLGEIFTYDGDGDGEGEAVAVAVDDIVLPEFKILRLYNLPNLTTFCSKRSSVISDTRVGTPIQQTFFSEKIVFPNLEELEVSGGCFEEIWPPQIPSNMVQNLKKVTRYNCKMMKEIVGTELGREEEEEALAEKKKINNIVFPQLHTLKLSNLEELTCFYHGNYTLEFPSLEKLNIFKCPKIETIAANSCGYKGTEMKRAYNQGSNNAKMVEGNPDDVMIQSLFNEKVLLPTLKELNVIGCDCLRNIVKPSIVKGLSCLEYIWISECSIMEEVVAKDEQSKQVYEDKVVVFPRVHTVKLRSLPNLRCFYPGNLTLEWPSLNRFSLDDCPHMKTFSSELVITPNLKQIETKYSYYYWESDLNSAIQQILKAKIVLPNLEELKVSGNFEEIWPPQISSESFCKLSVLVIDGFKKLKTSLSHNLEELTIKNCYFAEKVVKVPEGHGTSFLFLFPHLRKLEISSCEILKEIVGTELGGEEETLAEKKKKKINNIVFPQLHTLKLSNLEELTCFYHGNCTLEFPSLEALIIEKCPKMETMVAGSGPPRYHQVTQIRQTAFEEGSSNNAKMAEGINNPEEENVAMIQALFINEKVLLPMLRILSVEGCDCLRNLLTPSIVKGLPCLEKIEIGECSILEEVIAKELLQRQEISNIREEEASADKKKIIVFPQLHTLNLRNLQELTCFYHGNCILEFPSLKELSICSCRKMERMVSGSSGHKGIEMKKTFVERSSNNAKMAEGTNPKEEEEDDDDDDDDSVMIKALFNEKIVFPNLEVLKVSGNFEEIWSPRIQIPANNLFRLRVLEIDDCNKLKTAVPSNLAKRLQNLELLYVSDCHLVEEVVENVPEAEGHGTTILFPHLLKLDISLCEKMKEIVGTKLQGDDEAAVKNKIIVFPQLHTLDLWGLKELTCFYHGIYTLEFPSLEILSIHNCPKMETIAAYKEVSNNAKMAEGNLVDDAMIQSLFNEKVLLPNPTLKRLYINGLKCLKEIWYKQPLAESFCQLRILSVEGCDCLRKLLTPSIVKGLPCLEKIEIRRCSILEEVVAKELEQRLQVPEDKVVFPQVEEVQLNSLPNLRSFYAGDLTLVWPFLKRVYLQNCPHMQTFSSGLVFTENLNAVTIRTRSRRKKVQRLYWEGDLNSTIQHIFKEKIQS